ncbi:MAG: aminotransferase class I/II-fold pyridoxal phosphate-dependent enzyme [Lachnospiraceae bacterium]|nr:aminotransferase class I/II-fold pyridoxal phosphate-dependent enzyme [Lachnospiraceae bacterium]
MRENVHGGDIYNNRIEYDFSVNINPAGVPKNLMKAMKNAIEKVDVYPDINCTRLRSKIADYHGIKREDIICGNGASELLLAVAHGLQPKCIMVTAPSFLGYGQMAKSVDANMVYYPLNEENNFCIDEKIVDCIFDKYSINSSCEEAEVDMLILTNPNNPTGALINEGILEGIIRKCNEKGIVVVIDESFIELCTEACSFISRTGEYHNLIVLRAFTKSFAIPGVRLGYLVCSNISLLQQIEKHLPEWNVSVIAQSAGLAALDEKQYLKHSRKLIKKEREYLTKELERMHFNVVKSDASFILFYNHTGRDLYKRLLDNGILVRNCDNYKGLKKGYLRIAVRSHEDNKVLVSTLENIMGE